MIYTSMNSKQKNLKNNQFSITHNIIEIATCMRDKKISKLSIPPTSPSQLKDTNNETIINFAHHHNSYNIKIHIQLPNNLQLNNDKKIFLLQLINRNNIKVTDNCLKNCYINKADDYFNKNYFLQSSIDCKYWIESQDNNLITISLSYNFSTKKKKIYLLYINDICYILQLYNHQGYIIKSKNYLNNNFSIYHQPLLTDKEIFNTVISNHETNQSIHLSDFKMDNNNLVITSILQSSLSKIQLSANCKILKINLKNDKLDVSILSSCIANSEYIIGIKNQNNNSIEYYNCNSISAFFQKNEDEIYQLYINDDNNKNYSQFQYIAINEHQKPIMIKFKSSENLFTTKEIEEVEGWRMFNDEEIIKQLKDQKECSMAIELTIAMFLSLLEGCHHGCWNNSQIDQDRKNLILFLYLNAGHTAHITISYSRDNLIFWAIIKLINDREQLYNDKQYFDALMAIIESDNHFIEFWKGRFDKIIEQTEEYLGKTAIAMPTAKDLEKPEYCIKNFKNTTITQEDIKKFEDYMTNFETMTPTKEEMEKFKIIAEQNNKYRKNSNLLEEKQLLFDEKVQNLITKKQHNTEEQKKINQYNQKISSKKLDMSYLEDYINQRLQKSQAIEPKQQNQLNQPQEQQQDKQDQQKQQQANEEQEKQLNQQPIQPNNQQQSKQKVKGVDRVQGEENNKLDTTQIKNQQNQQQQLELQKQKQEEEAEEQQQKQQDQQIIIAQSQDNEKNNEVEEAKKPQTLKETETINHNLNSNNININSNLLAIMSQNAKNFNKKLAKNPNKMHEQLKNYGKPGYVMPSQQKLSLPEILEEKEDENDSSSYKCKERIYDSYTKTTSNQINNKGKNIIINSKQEKNNNTLQKQEQEKQNQQQHQNSIDENNNETVIQKEQKETSKTTSKQDDNKQKNNNTLQKQKIIYQILIVISILILLLIYIIYINYYKKPKDIIEENDFNNIDDINTNNNND